MNEHAKQTEEAYQRLPQSFREFAAIVYQTLKGYDLEESRVRSREVWSKRYPDHADPETQEIREILLKRAGEGYADARMRFTHALFHLCHRVCVSKKLCLTVAEWLNQQGRVLDENVEIAIRALSYLCGTEENRALAYLSTTTFEQLSDAYYEMIDFLDDDLLIPWVSDERKEEHRRWEENETLDEQSDE